MCSDLEEKEIVAATLVVIIVSSLIFGSGSTHEHAVNFFQIQEPTNSQRLFFSLPLVLGAGLHNETCLNQSTRARILAFIDENPGIHFRGICKGLGLSIGVVQYHVNVLAYNGLTVVYPDGRWKRFFKSGVFNETEIEIISLLRHSTLRSILATLMQTGLISHKKLASMQCISSQALTWRMKRLKALGFVDVMQEKTTIRYVLNSEKSEIMRQFIV